MQQDIDRKFSDLKSKILLLVKRIEELKAENEELKVSLQKAQETCDERETELARKESDMQSWMAGQGGPSSVDVGESFSYLSGEEREALEKQIDVLIAKIDAHLG
jgi:FtsZ-binding cell division protein ZapB